MQDQQNLTESNKLPKKRGVWLTAVLVLILVVNTFTSFLYITHPNLLVELYPKATSSVIYFLSILAIANIVLAIGIWRWKKWGVYGIYITIFTAFMVNLYIGLDMASALPGLVGAVFIFLTTRKTWPYFK